MKKGKRLLALIVAVSLVAGLAPMSSTSHAEETEATLNDTLLLSDDFSGSEWNTSTPSPVGYWRYKSADGSYVGVLDTEKGTAPLGNQNSNRNLYKSSDNDGKLADVHMKSKVCVTGDVNTYSSAMYHMLIARGTAAGQSGIVFGFETGDDEDMSSLIVALYEQNSAFTSTYLRTDADYPINNEYELELYVIGKSLVIAKCDGKTVFAGEVSNSISENGYCGIIDRLASSSSTATTYGGENGYQKGGYFDDFSISTITFDGFSVNGPVIVDPTGAGVADITVSSGGVEVAELQDVSVTVADMAGKGCSLYEGNYNVTTDVLGKEMTTVSNRIFVVESLKKAVTSMNDERWEGATDGTTKNFTVDASGKATLTNNVYSVLDLNGDNTAYTDFYAEYTLNVSDISDTTSSLFYNRFNITARNNNTSSYSGDVLYDTRTTQDTFYARFVKDKNTSSLIGTYAKGTSDYDVAIGTSMTISMLVYGNEIEFKINGNTVATSSESESISSGYFAIYNEVISRDTTNVPTPTAVATVDDFVFVPLTEKTVVDLEVSEIEDVQLYGEIATPEVTPIYSWPNEAGEATAENVTVEGFNGTRLGEQTVTVKYTEDDVTVSKDVTVNVVDNSVDIIATETFDSNPFDDTTGWTVSDNLVVNDGVLSLPSQANATAYTSTYFMDGYVQADINLKEPQIVSGKTVYAPTIICRQASTGGGEIRTRFAVKYDGEAYVAKIQTLVVDNKQYTGVASNVMYWGTDYTISDFNWDTTYTVRLTCIGNYVETKLNGAVIAQYIIPDEIGVNETEGNFGLQYDYTAANGYMTVVVDNLDVVKYTSYNINNQNMQIALPTYNKVKVSGTSYETATRNAFHSGETVILTVPEDQQLAVGGLTYTLDGVTDSATYSVFERLYDKDTKPEVCNQFKFKMPSSDITLSAQYYDANSGEANIGARDTGIRENDEEVKRGLRFSSRAYTTYISGETTYTLKEVGTLLFNGDIEITDDILENCYQTKKQDKNLYDNNEVLIGKCIPATKAQNICDDFWDWGVILTYQDSYEGTNLYEKEYTAYAYAVYVDSEGKEVVKYASDAKSATHSYNAVAEKIGWTTH